jgi:signal transduction histidine kinase
MGGRTETTSGVEPGVETAKLCHDLRQYVAAGMMLAGMREVAGLDAATRRRLDSITRVFEGINGLLEEQYDEERRSRSVNLGMVVEECVELTRLVSKVPIDVDLTAAVHACANPSVLRRAVLNVLNNATRAAGVGGRVSVNVGSAGNDAWVEVGDNGAGYGSIPAVNGLGMSIVEAAVRSARGRLEIYSGPGPGTRVRLRLPRGVGPVTER